MNYQKRKRTKKIIFYALLLLVISFLAYLLWPVSFDFNPTTFEKDKIKKEELIKAIIINDIEAVYDKNTNTYLFPVSEDQVNRNIPLNIKVLSNEKVAFVTTDNYNQNQKKFKMAAENPIKITVYNNNHYDITYINFTTIPIVSIETKDKISSLDQGGRVKLITDTNLMIYKADIRTRGNLSANFDKKNYRIKLKENDSLLGMEHSDVWALDGLYIDPSKIRNKIAFDIWNSINSYQADKDLDIDLESRFVEVFINNEYLGLYALKETVNRKKLNLNVTRGNKSGILLKGIGIGRIYYNKFDVEYNNSLDNTFFELNYPNDVSATSIYWQTILNKLKYYYSDEVFDEDILKEHFYIQNIIDNKILYTVTKSTDNCFVRNVYMSLKDIDSPKVILIPWDYDMTIGLRINIHSPHSSIAKYDTYNETSCSITSSLQPQLTETFKKRYQELRKNTITIEKLYPLLDKYRDTLVESGSLVRDANRWYQYNIEEEIEKVKIWFKSRLEYLDDYIGEL